MSYMGKCPSSVICLLTHNFRTFTLFRQLFWRRYWTDKGVFYSKDGVVWNALVNETGKPVIIKSLTTTGDSVYGANDAGIYHLEKATRTWEQIVPEIPDTITSLVVDEDTFYVGTEHRGVLRFERVNQ